MRLSVIAANAPDAARAAGETPGPAAAAGATWAPSDRAGGGGGAGGAAGPGAGGGGAVAPQRGAGGGGSAGGRCAGRRALDLDARVAGGDDEPLDARSLELADEVARLGPDRLELGVSVRVLIGHALSSIGDRVGWRPGAPKARKRS